MKWVLVSCRNVNLCQIGSTKCLMSSLLTQPLQSNGTLYHSISQFASLNWQHYRIKDQRSIRCCLRIVSWSLSGASAFSLFYLCHSHAVMFPHFSLLSPSSRCALIQSLSHSTIIACYHFRVTSVGWSNTTLSRTFDIRYCGLAK